VSNYRIVVGVDGSEAAHRALRWALREAAQRGGVVQAVTAWRWDAVDFPPYASDGPDDQRLRAEQILTDELAVVGAGSGVTMAAEVVEGRAADVLCAAARDADLLVLGSHGHSRVWHTVLGSVSEECVREAPCPIVIVPMAKQQPTRHAEPAVPG
jgi:nucleotide-binding universal stress UspA family protein